MPNTFIGEKVEKLVNKWKKGEIAWLIFAFLVVLATIVYKHIMVKEVGFYSIVSDVSALLGVIYVILIAKQDRKAYLFGMGNVFLYALAVNKKGLYISTLYNLLYSLPILIYGYIHWGKLEKNNNAAVKEFSLRERILGILLMIATTIGFAVFSKQILGGTNVLADSVVSVCVCVAMFLMTQKYVEQWMLFIISNFMGIILFFPKSFEDIYNIDLFAMWTIYFINSIYGYIIWKKAIVKEENIVAGDERE